MLSRSKTYWVKREAIQGKESSAHLTYYLRRKILNRVFFLKEDEEPILKPKINTFVKIRKEIFFFLDILCICVSFYVYMYMYMFSWKTLPKLVGKELSLCFNIPASKKDSINSLGKLTTSLPDILRNLLPPPAPPTHTHTNTLHTHAFYKTLSVRELFWESSLRPQANTGSTPLYTKFQGPSLTGLLTQSSS